MSSKIKGYNNKNSCELEIIFILKIINKKAYRVDLNIRMSIDGSI